MLYHRMKQFREYNDMEKWMVAELLNISAERYNALEEGKEEPTIDEILALARCYRVTVDEFYGYTPRMTLRSSDCKDNFCEEYEENEVSEALLRMSNLSWEEKQLILYYRQKGPDDEIIKTILKENFPQKD